MSINEKIGITGCIVIVLLVIAIIFYERSAEGDYTHLTGDLVLQNPGVLPNPYLTPGVINYDITQATIGDTICNPKWSTKSERPSSAYTTALKKKQLATGYTVLDDVKTADYEEDHLISLELGGNPIDPKNLWPESYTTTPNARDKDKTENYLHAQVCAGTITLAEAQKEIANNWVAVFMAHISAKYGSVNNSDADDQ